jgi:hypothetical protein
MPAPGKRHDTLIRRNLFSKEGAASGPQPRPNVLLGHFPPSGPGVDDRYIVYNNIFHRNPAEALLQAEGNLIIFANFFVNPDGPAIRIQPHNHVPMTVYVFNNTVLAQDEGVVIRNREPPAWPQQVFANAIFSASPLSGGHVVGNLLGTFGEASRYVRNPSGSLDDIDPALLHVVRYRDIVPWPELPFRPTGLDGNPLVPGEVGAVTSSATGRLRRPGARL